MSGLDSGRDRDLENLLGQFLVATFQSDKLAGMIYEKFSFRGRPKEIRVLIPSSGVGLTTTGGGSERPPLMMTLRIEPYYSPQLEQSSLRKEPPQKEAIKIVSILESPPLILNSGSRDPTIETEEILAESLNWWNAQGGLEEFKLGEWKISTSIINAMDSEGTKEVYRILDALAARRPRSDEQSAASP